MTRRNFLKAALFTVATIPFLGKIVPAKYAHGSICPACGEDRVVVKNAEFIC
jgi:hypothetical protein